MKRTTFTNHINALKSEVLMLLRFQLASNRILEFEDINRINRSSFIDKIIAAKAIENDMLIRLCKFDDNTKGVHSFPKALSEIPLNHPNKKEIKEYCKIFSKMIDEIKKERRHTQLAHLKIGEKDNDYEPRYNFTPIIELYLTAN